MLWFWSDVAFGTSRTSNLTKKKILILVMILNRDLYARWHKMQFNRIAQVSNMHEHEHGEVIFED